MDELEQRWSDVLRRVVPAAERAPRVEADRAALQPAELLVLRALSHGLTEDEAAVVLGWSSSVVHDLAKRARRALGAKNSAQAVAKALRAGLID